MNWMLFLGGILIGHAIMNLCFPRPMYRKAYSLIPLLGGIALTILFW